MPRCAAFVDALRAEFGATAFDAAMKRGMRGEPGFWAQEGGVEIGTREPEPQVAFTAAEIVVVVKAASAKGER